jgi:hypothetical protein
MMEQPRNELATPPRLTGIEVAAAFLGYVIVASAILFAILIIDKENVLFSVLGIWYAAGLVMKVHDRLIKRWRRNG